MKKSIHLLCGVTFMLLYMCSSLTAKAQADTSHVFHVSTWYMVTGLDSVARAGRAAVLNEYFTKVTLKNEYVIHQWNMTHLFTEDSREFVTISEYATWDDVRKAENRNAELLRQAWPDMQGRQDYMKKLNSYVTHHKDAIYIGLSRLIK
jgi:hypothetical protein